MILMERVYNVALKAAPNPFLCPLYLNKICLNLMIVMLIFPQSAFPSCTTLRQGALTKSVGREAETKQPEVTVHKTMLSTPQRRLKEQFVKRLENCF